MPQEISRHFPVLAEQSYQEKIQFESEGMLFPSFQHRDDIDAMPRERWELLYDPTPSRSLKRTRQQASIVAQQMLVKSHVSTVCLLDQKTETTGYTVLFAVNALAVANRLIGVGCLKRRAQDLHV